MIEDCLENFGLEFESVFFDNDGVLHAVGCVYKPKFETRNFDFSDDRKLSGREYLLTNWNYLGWKNIRGNRSEYRHVQVRSLNRLAARNSGSEILRIARRGK